MTSPPEPTNLLTTHEAAKLLGVTEGYLQKLVEEGIVPYFGAGLFEEKLLKEFKTLYLANKTLKTESP